MVMSDSKINSVQHYVPFELIQAKATAIAKKYRPEKIILFGSYAAGNPTAISDVDLLVILNTEQSTWDISVEISLMLKHEFPMDILVRTPIEIAKRLKNGDFFIREILENGKILYERNS
jgi:uncharacterized protein